MGNGASLGCPPSDEDADRQVRVEGCGPRHIQSQTLLRTRQVFLKTSLIAPAALYQSPVPTPLPLPSQQPTWLLKTWEDYTFQFALLSLRNLDAFSPPLTAIRWVFENQSREPLPTHAHLP